MHGQIIKSLGFLSILLFFTGCNEILTVVTGSEAGEKIVRNYISLYSNTIYDDTVSFKSALSEFDDGFNDADDILFLIRNKDLLVFGDESAAIEIKFFEGGYNITLFTSSEAIDKAFRSF